MPDYDSSRFDPPAPVAAVTLHNPADGARIDDVVLLLDTGADITLLPREAIERLGVTVLTDGGYELIGFDGSRSFAPAVALDVVFLRRTFRGRYVLMDGDTGILGRDVLNHVAILLDGRREQWSEHRP